MKSRFLLLALLGLLLSLPVHAQSEGPDNALRQRLLQALGGGFDQQGREVDEDWIALRSPLIRKKIPARKERIDLLTTLYLEARRANLAPDLVFALVQVESNFEVRAISKAGALGLMQIMPFWLEELGRGNDDLFDMATNLRIGCTILRYYLDLEKGDMTRALARYNGSLGQKVYPDKVYSKLRRLLKGYATQAAS